MKDTIICAGILPTSGALFIKTLDNYRPVQFAGSYAKKTTKTVGLRGCEEVDADSDCGLS